MTYNVLMFHSFREYITQNSGEVDGNVELGFFKSELNAELNRLNKVCYHRHINRLNVG